MIYWFTGQPGAGKTTMAKQLKSFMPDIHKSIHIDGDDLRDLFDNKDYSEQGRRRNIQRAQDITTFMSHKGFDVIVSLVSPYKDMREDFKKNNEVIEIYVHTNEIRGRENFHVRDYEPPTENFIDLDTTNKDEKETIFELLKKIPL